MICLVEYSVIILPASLPNDQRAAWSQSSPLPTEHQLDGVTSWTRGRSGQHSKWWALALRVASSKWKDMVFRSRTPLIGERSWLTVTLLQQSREEPLDRAIGGLSLPISERRLLWSGLIFLLFISRPAMRKATQAATEWKVVLIAAAISAWETHMHESLTQYVEITHTCCEMMKCNSVQV